MPLSQWHANRLVARGLAWALIDATSLQDPWDASPPTLEIMRTKCICFQLLQLAVIFSLAAAGSLQCFFRGKNREWNGETLA